MLLSPFFQLTRLALLALPLASLSSAALAERLIEKTWSESTTKCDSTSACTAYQLWMGDIDIGLDQQMVSGEHRA